MRNKHANNILNETRKKTNEQFNQRRYKKDDDGRVIINMVVKDDSGFLSPFSENDAPSISSEVAEFLENETKTMLPRQLLTLRIKSNCIDDVEKELYIRAINEYYTRTYIVNEKEIKRNNVLSVILFITGLIILTIAIAFSNVIWSEVLDIAAWVFLWETVDVAVFKIRYQKMQRYRYLSFLSMKIEYYDINDGDDKNE